MVLLEQVEKVVEEATVLKEPGEIDAEAKEVDEQMLHSQALDEANLMVEGVILSDTELLLEDGEELEDWEQGEIMDFAEEEEEATVENQEEVKQTDQVPGQIEMEEQMEGNVTEDKAMKKKGSKPEASAPGGPSKKRGVPGFVSPRKKLLALAAAKQGEKTKKAPIKPKHTAA
ncbi:Uncharacterized protein Rs2_07021 [Raphanus sativus]|nr:Uncharacterized protein Rs2_07021 [Raphanus sativus]